MRAREVRHHTKLIVFLTLLVLLAGICCSVNIREITITGNSQYSDQELADKIFDRPLSYNSLYCLLNNRFGRQVSIPFIEDYQLSFASPTRVEIIVHEKSIVGYVSYMSSYMYFDKDGIVVESANRRLDGIPHIEGLKFGQIVLHQELPVENRKVFDTILNLTQVLTTHHIEVDEIRFDAHNAPTLYMSGIQVILGDDDYLDSKISLLSDMIPSLEGLDGVLYLNSFDPNGSNKMYTFKRKTQM